MRVEKTVPSIEPSLDPCVVELSQPLSPPVARLFEDSLGVDQPS